MEMEKKIAESLSDVLIDTVIPYKEIVASLITSATSIRNTNRITQSVYAQINAQLKACKEYIDANNTQFFARMKEREEILTAYRKLLETFSGLLPHSTGETALYCTKLMETVILQMSEIGTNGPEIIKPPRF